MTVSVKARACRFKRNDQAVVAERGGVRFLEASQPSIKKWVPANDSSWPKAADHQGLLPTWSGWRTE